MRLNPFSALWGPIPLTGEYRAGLEFIAGPSSSYCFTAGYLDKSPIFSLLAQASGLNPRDVQFQGFRVSAQYRYYLSKFSSKKKISGLLSPSGIYAAVNGSYAAATLKLRGTTQIRTEFTNFHGTVIFGIQPVVSNTFGVDMFMGLGYKQHIVLEFDHLGRVSRPNLDDYGPTYGNPFKFILGFSCVFGLF